MDVVNTDVFLDLPISAQALYFHFGMRADDEGFVSSPKTITRMVGCAPGDMEVLAKAGYIIPFESGVVVIRDWKLNNYLQNDRCKPTIHSSEKKRIIERDKIYIVIERESEQ